MKKTKKKLKPATLEEGNAALIILAEKLETIPKERFNYNVWVGENWGGRVDLSCGTTACAMGWATTIPALRKLGLRMSRTEFIPRVDLDLYNNPSMRFMDSGVYSASLLIFALSRPEHRLVFLPEGGDIKMTPGNVAIRIRKLVDFRVQLGAQLDHLQCLGIKQLGY